jgi:hypothetical protein
MRGLLVLWLIGLVLTSGCLCCGGFLSGREDCPEPRVLINDVCCMDANGNGVCDELETTIPPVTIAQTTIPETTTLPAVHETTTTVAVTTTMAAEETVSTTTTIPLSECLKKYQVNVNEVVFLYTRACCTPLANTVNQLGSIRFEKIEVQHTTPRERNILKCLGIEDPSSIQLAQFICPANNERMIITPEEFKGARTQIAEFASKCKQDAKNA